MKTIYSLDDYLVSKKLETIMEVGLRLQIEKLEAKLKRYERDNEDLRDKNKNLEVIIEIHKIEEKYKEKNISDEKNHIEKLFAQIEE